MKINKKNFILTTLVCLLPIIAGIIFYPQLPETIATHWDAHGNVNGTSSKFVGAIVFPGILLIINMAFPFLLATDPKYKNMNETLKAIVHWIIPAVEVVCSGITLATALGRELPVAAIGTAFVGIIIIIAAAPIIYSYVYNLKHKTDS